MDKNNNNKKSTKKFPSWARLMTKEEATEANNGGVTLTLWNGYSKKPERKDKK